MMIQAMTALETDSSLENSDKLVLIRWAWKCREGCPPSIIRYKTYARELGLAVNTIKASVKRLTQAGYFVEIATTVSNGPKMAAKPKQGDQPLTPKGSTTDPQRDQPLTPLQNNNIKKAEQLRKSQISDLRKQRTEAVNALKSVNVTALEKKQIREWLDATSKARRTA